MARVADHLSVAVLERRLVDCADRVEARHVQVNWLLAQGHTVRATSKVTAFGTRWLEQMLERYNTSGPDALADEYRRNGPKPHLLTPEVLAVVRLRLAEPPPDGGYGRAARWPTSSRPTSGWSVSCPSAAGMRCRRSATRCSGRGVQRQST